MRRIGITTKGIKTQKRLITELDLEIKRHDGIASRASKQEIISVARECKRVIPELRARIKDLINSDEYKELESKSHLYDTTEDMHEMVIDMVDKVTLKRAGSERYEEVLGMIYLCVYSVIIIDTDGADVENLIETFKDKLENN